MSESLEQRRQSLALAKAIAFYRRNPQATLSEVSAACEVSERTAWKARQQCVIEGVCKPNKRAGRSLEAPKPGPQEIPTSPAPLPPKNTIIDGEQLAALAEGDLTIADDADPETRKKMLRELRGIAFSPNHPEVRVMAMKAWFALKDMASAKDLGPGTPKSEEAAITRLADLDLACGLKIAVKALIKAFSLMTVLTFIEEMFRKEPTDAQPQSPAVESSLAPPPVVQPPLTPDNDPPARDVQG